MKIFAIRDANDITEKDLAYMLYYEREKVFYIELPEDADFWNTPLLLSSFAKRNIRTINPYFSKLWVQQRIIPSDRQNLGQILKENGLEEYDEYKLLMLADGRCEQDDYYLYPVVGAYLEKFEKRYRFKVEDIVPLENANLLVFFRDGTVKKCDAKVLLGEKYQGIWNNSQMFRKVSVQVGGYGIEWSEICSISDEQLYNSGLEVPLSLEDFGSFVKNRVVSTKEATELLDCSRQNIDDLVRRKKLEPLKIDSKNKLFYRKDIEQRRCE